MLRRDLLPDRDVDILAEFLPAVLDIHRNHRHLSLRRDKRNAAFRPSERTVLGAGALRKDNEYTPFPEALQRLFDRSVILRAPPYRKRAELRNKPRKYRVYLEKFLLRHEGVLTLEGDAHHRRIVV